MKKNLAEWAPKYRVALSAAVIVAVIVLTVVFWGWLNNGESGSTTIRNVGLVIGGVIALAIAGWRSVVADRQSRAAHRQADTAQADLRNRRYQESAEMLGSEVLAVRLAGIYALSRLAEDDPEGYHIEIMRLLCTFVRNPTKDEGLESTSDMEVEGDSQRSGQRPMRTLRADVQGVMDAICARRDRQLDLEAGANFSLDMHGVDLRGANLQDGNLMGSEWTDSQGLWQLRSDFSDAKMEHANLSGTRLSNAKLSRADLERAVLLGTGLRNTDLSGENLTAAWLMGPVYLTQRQLDDARADPVRPPRLDGVRDADSGKQLVWRVRTLDGSPHPNPPPIPDD